MLSLRDNIAVLWRFKIIYDNGLEEGLTQEEYACSAAEKDRLLELHREAEITPIDQGGNEWIDGMHFDSRDEAMRALEMGEEGYRKYLYDNDAELQTAGYLLELDSRLIKLEWGL